MESWTRILTVPGMGGSFMLSAITVWVLFLGSLVAWIIRAPRDRDW
ncbi:MAG: hypothetical protein ACE5MB_00240 [Anaerolineae bacterium]